MYEIVENSYVLMTALDKESTLHSFHGEVGIVAKVNSNQIFVLMRDGNGFVMAANVPSETLYLSSINVKMISGLVINDLQVYLGRLREYQQKNQQSWSATWSGFLNELLKAKLAQVASEDPLSPRTRHRVTREGFAGIV